MTEIKVLKKNGSELTCKIDTSDLEKVKEFGTWFAEWHKDFNNYLIQTLVKTNVNGKVKYIKRSIQSVILDVNPKAPIKHLNGDTLDNRKDNLRGATSSQNQINRSKQRNNKSGVTGVYYCNTKKKWKAILEKEGAILIRKYFDNKEDAIKCRLNGEKKYFGEYAPQKHLFEQYGID